MFCFFLLKYPPILLVLVGDGDPDGLSSPPHLLSRGVIAEQGKASQLVLTGDAEICKAEKQDKKGFKRATIVTSCPFGSILLLSEHTQGSAAGYTAPSPTGKSKCTLGTRRVQRALYGPPCMDQGAHGPAGDFPPPGALCKLGGAGRALGTSALTL